MIVCLLASAPSGRAAGADGPSVAAGVAAASRYVSGASCAPLRQVERWVAASAGDSSLRRELETELVNLLNSESASYEARRFACYQLAVIGSERCLPALTRSLRTPDTAGIACLALANIPGERTDAVLRDAAAKLTGTPRIEALKTLGTRRDAAAVPLLIRAAVETNTAVAEVAIIALGRIASPSALTNLAKMRADPRPGMTAIVDEATLTAAERLAEAGDRSQAERLRLGLLGVMVSPALRRGALIALFGMDSDAGLARIFEVLDTQDRVLKPVAIARVPALPDKQATPRLAARLPGLDPADQVLLIEALAERGDPAARPEVVGLLASGDPAVRGAAVDALGTLGDASTVPSLCRLFQTAQTPAETRRIELALARLPGGEAADRALMARLRDRMAVPRIPVLSALVRRGSRTALPMLLTEAASTDPATARLAFQGLNRAAVADDLPALLDALGNLQAADARDECETSVAQALERLAPPSRRSQTLRDAIARAGSPQARNAFVRLLPVAGDKRALESAQAALEDPPTRDAALYALSIWPDPAAWDTLVDSYGRAATDGQRARLLQGMVRLAVEANAQPTPALIERYRRLFALAKDDGDRKRILGGLSGCHDPGALDLAVAQLGAAGVRAEAVQAVQTIAGAIRTQHPQAAQAALDRLNSP